MCFGLAMTFLAESFKSKGRIFTRSSPSGRCLLLQQLCGHSGGTVVISVGATQQFMSQLHDKYAEKPGNTKTYIQTCALWAST